MADYWKSNEKHYCDFCKCWTANNKASIEFHEKGKNHQANVKRRLAEIKQKSIEKRKNDEASKKMFAQMEKNALAAVQKDLQGTSGSLGRGDMKKIVEAQSDKKTDNTDTLTYPWKTMAAPQGFTYYYNVETGESTWQMPRVFKELQQKEAKEKSGKEIEEAAKKINNQNTEDPYRKKKVKPEEPEEPEVYNVHPLLGGWSTVKSYSNEDEDDDSKTSNNSTNAIKNEDDDSSTIKQESKSEADGNQIKEERQSGKKFKEKIMKTTITTGDEPASFKKRKSGNRNVRKRMDDD